MNSLKKYNLAGEEIGVEPLGLNILDVTEIKKKSQLIKDTIVSALNNQRQWSACTKTRSDVKHTTKKCRPQKGTGGARHGMLVAPQYRGGGTVFGPIRETGTVHKINARQGRVALTHVLSSAIHENRVEILESKVSGKTREIANYLEKRGCVNQRVLFLDLQKNELFQRAARNIDLAENKKKTKKATYRLVYNVSILEVAKANRIVLLGSNSLVGTDDAVGFRELLARGQSKVSSEKPSKEEKKA